MENLNCVDLSRNELLSSKFAHFLRIKPSVKSSEEEDGPYQVIDSNILSVDLRKSDSNKDKGELMRLFAFTELLDDSVSQRSVFSKCCLPLINDVLNGINGLLFCIGQSYTMRGSIENPSCDPGLVSLCLEMIFSKRSFVIDPLSGKTNSTDQESELSNPNSDDDHLDFDDEENIEYQNVCYLSHFEIYNNFIYDLLALSSDGLISPLPLFSEDEQNQPKTELQSVLVSSFEEALGIYSIGAKNLHNKNTLENISGSSMSRRHSFFCVSLIKFKQNKGKVLESKVSHLTLGDFSGFESSNQMVKILTKLVQLEDRFDLSKTTLKSLADDRKVWIIVDIDPSSMLLHKTLKSLQLGVTTFHNLPSIFTDRPHRSVKANENSTLTSDQESQTENLEFVPVERLESYEKKVSLLERELTDLKKKSVNCACENQTGEIIIGDDTIVVQDSHEREIKELKEMIKKENQVKLQSIYEKAKDHLNQFKEKMAHLLNIAKDEEPQTEIIDCSFHQLEPTKVFQQDSNQSDPEEAQDCDRFSVISLKRRRSTRSKCLQEITSQSNCCPDSVLESHLIEKKKKFCNSIDQSRGSTTDENINFESFNSSLSPLPKYLPDSSNCGLDNNEISNNHFHVRICPLCPWIERVQSCHYNDHFREYHRAIVLENQSLISQFKETIMDRKRYESLKDEWRKNLKKDLFG